MSARKEKGDTLGYVLVGIDSDGDAKVDTDYDYAMDKDTALDVRETGQYVAALVVVSD